MPPLPPDILLIDSHLCAADIPNPFLPHTRVALSCVSRIWRHTLLNDPTFWNLVNCDYPQAALSFFNRSTPLLVSVNINGRNSHKNSEDGWREFSTTLSQILLESHRVRDLTMEPHISTEAFSEEAIREEHTARDDVGPSQLEGHIQLLLRMVRPSFTNLDTLSLSPFIPSQRIPNEDIHMDRQALLFPLGVSTSLRMLWIRNSPLQLERFIQCRLTSLRVAAFNIELVPGQWRQLLTSLAPALEDFRLSVQHIYHTVRLTPGPEIVMTALKTLAFQIPYSGSEVRPLIHQLTLPRGVRVINNQRAEWATAAHLVNHVFAGDHSSDSVFSLSYSTNTFCFADVVDTPASNWETAQGGGRQLSMRMTANRRYMGMLLEHLDPKLLPSITYLRLYDSSQYQHLERPPWSQLSAQLPAVTELSLSTGPRSHYINRKDASLQHEEINAVQPPRKFRSSIFRSWSRKPQKADQSASSGDGPGDTSDTGIILARLFPMVTVLRLESAYLTNPEDLEEILLLEALAARKREHLAITSLYLDKWSSISSVMRDALGPDMDVWLETGRSHHEKLPHEGGKEGHVWKGRCIQEGRIQDHVLRWCRSLDLKDKDGLQPISPEDIPSDDEDDGIW
jgi:hypothetical protein